MCIMRKTVGIPIKILYKRKNRQKTLTHDRK